MSDKILVINAGSSSIKFQLFTIVSTKPEFLVLAKGLVERIGIKGSQIITEVAQDHDFTKHPLETNIPDHNVGAKLIIEQLIKLQVIKDFSEIKGIGHRLVHGGEKFKTSVLINEQVVKSLEESIELAPLHNPPALSGYDAFKRLNEKTKHVGVFDTSFHMTLPEEKFLYSVPYQWYEKYQVRRYGFHGISYRYILSKLSEVTKKNSNNINAIVCHLGNGASICAIKNGQSFNTSMGLTPLDGLIMGTRSGIIDPSIPNYVCQKTKQSIADVTASLNKESGLLGISGFSSDLRDVIAAKLDKTHAQHERATLAIKMFVQRIASYIVQYTNDLENNIDALVFTAGIGENSDVVRQWVIDEIKVLKLKIDNKLNKDKYGDYLVISEKDSQMPIYKIRTNEEIMICHDTFSLIK